MSQAIILATIGVLIAVYEWVAIRTRKVPTVTAIIKSLPWPARIGVVALTVAATIDHFLIGWIV